MEKMKFGMLLCMLDRKITAAIVGLDVNASNRFGMLLNFMINQLMVYM